MRNQPLPALTGIRFFLALWVVIYHQILSLPPHSLGTATEAILSTGYSAVTGFFVLSGFVLAYNYNLNQPPASSNLRAFAIARFSRIYPAYLTGLLLLLPLAFYRLSLGIEIAPPAEEWGSLLLNLVLLQAWLPQTALTWNFPGWSLSNEAFFYACFPVVGFWLWRRSSPMLTMLVLWLLACIPPLVAMWWPAHHWGDIPATTHVLASDVSIWAGIIRYNPLIRLSEFCCGIMLAKLFLQFPEAHRLRNHGQWLYLPSALVIAAILAKADSLPYPPLHNGLMVPLYAAFLFGLALSGGFFDKFLSTPALQFVGNASYSMYILHAPTYQWLDIFFRRVLDREAQGWFWFFSYLSVTLIGACVFYQWVEDPLHRMCRSWLTRFLMPPSDNCLIRERPHQSQS